jgi:hypothetical protein
MRNKWRYQLTVLFVLTSSAASQVSSAQERAPNGQVYAELRPFVGLNGVRFEVEGLGGAIWNVVGVTGDPETTLTGLSGSAREQLYMQINADTTTAFRVASIPLLERAADGRDTRPRLVLDVSWYRVAADTFSLQVDIRLLEAASLLKDPATLVWTSTWGEIFRRPVSLTDLQLTLRSSCSGAVANFIRLYVRAHARTG